MPPEFKAGFLAVVEQHINRYLSLDPVNQEKLSRCFGKVILLQCRTPSWSCYMHFDHDHVRLTGFFDGVEDAKFNGSSVSFSTLLIHRNLPMSDIPDLTLTGDAELIAELQAVYQEMEIDWERPLCQFFGDIPGHLIAQGLRSAVSCGQRVQKVIMDNLGDYLQEELRLIPSRVELESFTEERERLDEMMDSLEYRWKAFCHTDSNTGCKS